MKRIARLLSAFAVTLAACTSAAYAAGMDYSAITPSVKAFLAQKPGIPGTDLPGVIETAVVAALIWAFSLGINFITGPQTAADEHPDESSLHGAH